MSKMPPKKSNYGRKSTKAKQMHQTTNNLSPESKEKLLKRKRESMQKYRANMDEEKLGDIQIQNMYLLNHYYSVNKKSKQKHCGPSSM